MVLIGVHALAVVWLVEAKQVSRCILAGERSGLHPGSPLACVVGVVGVQHGDELVPGTKVTPGAGVPVVGPDSD